jgi:AcrR family transcriptional regulator
VLAARTVAVQRGPGGLTLRAVAAQSAISLSNLQYHFASQDELLRAVLDAELASGEAFVAQAIAACPDDPPGAAIDALLELQHQRGAARLFFSLWAMATTSRSLRSALHAFYAGFVERIALVAPPEAKQRAWLVVALLEGASLFRCGVAGSSDGVQEAALRTQLRALMGYPAVSGARPTVRSSSARSPSSGQP